MFSSYLFLIMSKGFYKYTAVTTITAVFFLILVGSIVRSTGAGMGCPDWPKCFGMWIPPTAEDQLPYNYKEIFGEKLKGEVSFNVVKTWTEYVNRLLGVLIGLLIFATFLSAAFTFWRSSKKVVIITFTALVAVGFQGWLGSRVVATELLPWMITTHLLVAVLIVGLLIWGLVSAEVIWQNEQEVDQSLSFAMLVLFIFSVGQFILGTRVREGIDYLNRNDVIRLEWIDNLGGVLYVHGISAVILWLVHYFVIKKLKTNVAKPIGRLLDYLLIFISLSVLSGGVLGVLNMPAYAQPIHLTTASLLLGTQFAIYLVNTKGNLT